MKQKSSVPSPCISVCTVDEETDYCRGCLRTLQEISDWEGLSDEGKKKVWDKLAIRRKEADGGTNPSHC